jgi:hypothetical protein
MQSESARSRAVVLLCFLASLQPPADRNTTNQSCNQDSNDDQDERLYVQRLSVVFVTSHFGFLDSHDSYPETMAGVSGWDNALNLSEPLAVLIIPNRIG